MIKINKQAYVGWRFFMKNYDNSSQIKNDLLNLNTAI